MFKDQLYKAVIAAIEEIGLDNLKKISWFMSNRKQWKMNRTGAPEPP